MSNHLFICLFVLFSLNSMAVGPELTYQGRILKPSGDPLTEPAVQFKIQIRSPGSESCLMYEETQTLDLSATNGVFKLKLNGSTSTRTDTSGIAIGDLFTNRKNLTFTNGQCASGTTYNPDTTEGRKLEISFDDGSGGGWEPFPSQDINYSAMAIESLAVGGFSSQSLLRVENASGPQVASSITPANFTELLALLNGTTTQYLKTSDPAVGFSGNLGGDVTGSQSATSVEKIRGTEVSNSAPTSGQVLQYNGTQWAPTTLSLTNGTVTEVTSANSYISVANGTTTPALTLNVGTAANTVAAGNDSRIVNALQPNTTIGGSTAINTSGAIETSGTVTAANVSVANISATNLKIYNASNYVEILAPNLGGNLTFNLPNSLGSNGQFLITNGSGVLSWSSISSDVHSTSLTGINTTSTTSTVTSSDTVLSGIGKLQGQLANKASLSGASFTGAITSTSTVTATAFYYTSDRRLKKNIKNIENPIDKILALRGVTFDWKKNNQSEIGFIAQEVEQVAPELVQTQNAGKKDELKSVKYANIVAIVVAAIHEFFDQWQIDKAELNQKINLLEKKNQELESAYLSLHKDVEQLKKNQRHPATSVSESIPNH